MIQALWQNTGGWCTGLFLFFYFFYFYFMSFSGLVAENCGVVHGLLYRFLVALNPGFSR
jgi:hypothetical protein